MNGQSQSKHIGLKTWYVIAIILSVIVLLVSVVGLVGTWVGESALSRGAVSVLGVASNTAGAVRQVNQKLDQVASQIIQVTSEVSGTSSKISQNVNDQGLLATLLPAEQEQKLAGSISSLQDTFTNIRDVLNQVVQLYRTVDKLPFVSLPAPSQDQLTKISQAVDKGKAGVAALRQGVQDFRSGAAAKIDVVTQAADQVTQAMNDLRSNLAKLDSDLASFQALMARLQQVIPTVLILLAILATLLLAYIIYTQVEIIRLYVQRWRLLNQPQTVLPADTETANKLEPTQPDK